MWRHVECSKIKLNFEALIGFGVFFLSTNIFFRILKYPGSQGSLAEGEESVQLTSLYYFISAIFILKILFTFFLKSFLNEEVNCSKPSLSVIIPWFHD
jgi:hypothetical protein